MQCMNREEKKKRKREGTFLESSIDLGHCFSHARTSARLASAWWLGPMEDAISSESITSALVRSPLIHGLNAASLTSINGR